MSATIKTKRWPFWVLAGVSIVAVIAIIATNQARTRDRLHTAATAPVATGMMRLGMVPEPVRAPLPEWETEIKAEDVPPLPLELSPGALERQRAKMEKGPCADWRNCIRGFPEDRYGR